MLLITDKKEKGEQQWESSACAALLMLLTVIHKYISLKYISLKSTNQLLKWLLIILIEDY